MNLISYLIIWDDASFLTALLPTLQLQVITPCNGAAARPTRSLISYLTIWDDASFLTAPVTHALVAGDNTMQRHGCNTCKGKNLKSSIGILNRRSGQ